MKFSSSAKFVGESKPDLEIKRQILAKLVKRKEFRESCPLSENFCAELNPDVIVISDDQSFLFEPQNQHALELLTLGCGLTLESLKLPERVRVHPLKSGKIIDELRIAGLTVAC